MVNIAKSFDRIYRSYALTSGSLSQASTMHLSGHPTLLATRYKFPRYAFISAETIAAANFAISSSLAFITCALVILRPSSWCFSQYTSSSLKMTFPQIGHACGFPRPPSQLRISLRNCFSSFLQCFLSSSLLPRYHFPSTMRAISPSRMIPLSVVMYQTRSFFGISGSFSYTFIATPSTFPCVSSSMQLS